MLKKTFRRALEFFTEEAETKDEEEEGIISTLLLRVVTPVQHYRCRLVFLLDRKPFELCGGGLAS